MINFSLRLEQSIHEQIQNIDIPSADIYHIKIKAIADERIIFETKRGTRIPKEYFSNVYNNTNQQRYKIIQQRMKEEKILEAKVEIIPIKKNN